MATLIDGGTPYADAVAANAAQDLLHLNVPGHSSDDQAAPELAEFLSSRVLQKDVSPLLSGIDHGDNSPFDKALALAAEAWGARQSWFLTNGASQANRIGALTFGAFRGPEQQVLVQRSAHSSFIDGIILAGLQPVFMRPLIDESYGIAHGLSVAELERSLAETPSPKAVYVVSPSYFGAVADIAAFAELAHAAGVPLMVDEAWGAHFGFHPALPQSALSLGADLVVSSTHKLGGSLTQSAMLHLGEGPFAAELAPLVQRAYMITMSTSQSALLLASLDIARHGLVTGTQRLGEAIEAADRIRQQLRQRGRFRVVSDSWNFEEVLASDPLRISVDVRAAGLNGHAVREELIRASGVYTEISTDACIVAFLGPGFAPHDDRFIDALYRLEPTADLAYAETHSLPLPDFGELSMSPRDAWLAPAETVTADRALGRVSADSLAAYPPGIPNVMPGEVITRELIEFLRGAAASPGGYVRGSIDSAVDHFRVVAGGAA